MGQTFKNCCLTQKKSDAEFRCALCSEMHQGLFLAESGLAHKLCPQLFQTGEDVIHMPGLARTWECLG